MTEWQPIEAAPKDGTYVLTWDPVCGCEVLCWDPVVNQHELSELANNGIDAESAGWMKCGCGPATHWMPLPEPPVELPPGHRSGGRGMTAEAYEEYEERRLADYHERVERGEA
jgi:hypothetical protein